VQTSRGADHHEPVVYQQSATATYHNTQCAYFVQRDSPITKVATATTQATVAEYDTSQHFVIGTESMETWC
jgi:hypothetical protein